MRVEWSQNTKWWRRLNYFISSRTVANFSDGALKELVDIKIFFQLYQVLFNFFHYEQFDIQFHLMERRNYYKFLWNNRDCTMWYFSKEFSLLLFQNKKSFTKKSFFSNLIPDFRRIFVQICCVLIRWNTSWTTFKEKK